MLKTLKSKISLIYLLLVVLIAIIGTVSVLSLYNLSKSTNGLIANNYNSIKSASKMRDSLESQIYLQQDYIYTGSQDTLNKFYKEASAFYSWYNIEVNNITEPGEKAVINNINKYYTQYQTQFAQVLKLRGGYGVTAAAEYSSKNILPAINILKIEIDNITQINEKAMFNSKRVVTVSAINTMYIIMTLSLFFIIAGYIFSKFYTGKFLKPLYVLKENIEAVREGNLEQQARVESNDEIGDLAVEFNKMTERLLEFEKSTKGKLLEEKNRSLSIVKCIPDPVIVLNTNYKIMLLNHACKTFFYVDENESINKYFLEVIKSSEIYEHIIDACSSKDDKYRSRIVSINVGEKQFYFDIIVTKIKNINSDINGYVVLFQNITKLKKLEKAKTEFVSTISHEFKTPLTSIMMGTSLIKNNALGELNSKQTDIVHTIEDDTERLTTLVNNIIQLSKVESEKEFFHFEPCSVFGIVENSIKGFIEITHSKNISLYSIVDENLPKIYADFEKTSWVINNLISNAVKFTNAGDEIVIDAKVSYKYMQISVKDTGIGIPEEYRQKIFDKFVKVESPDAESIGTGLGLAIAKEIVEIHRGTIYCDSKIDEGSTFTFTVPLAEQ